MNRLLNKWSKIPLSVKVSTSYAMCSIIQRCISFFTMPFFARILTKEQYGQVTIYNSWSGILSIVITLNLAYGSFSTAMVKFDKDRESYISSIEGICLVLASLFFVIYLPFRKLWNSLFELPTYIMCIMVVEILCLTAFQLWSGKQRFEFKYKLVIAITLLMTVLSVILQFFLVVSYEEKGFSRIIGAAIATIIIGLFFYIWNAVKGKKLFNKKYWKYALEFNVPLLAYYLSQIVFNQSDRIMISHIVGTDKAAEYGVAYTLAFILTFVLNAINNSYVPWYYGKIKEGKTQENKSVSLGIAGIMSILILGVIWFAPEIISLMSGEQYLSAVNVVPPVAISLLLLFYSQLFINVEFYYEEKKKLVWASIGSALINIILNFIFIKIFGFIAAAYTTLISYSVFAFANCIAMKKVLKDKNVEDNAYDYKLLVCLFLGFVIVAYIGVAIYNYLIPRIIVCVIVVLILFIKRNMIIKLLMRIKTK